VDPLALGLGVLAVVALVVPLPAVLQQDPLNLPVVTVPTVQALPSSTGMAVAAADRQPAVPPAVMRSVHRVAPVREVAEMLAQISALQQLAQCLAAVGVVGRD
jgi:hypothetical protein